MSRVFLYGDIAHNFGEISRLFARSVISSAAGKNAEVALLLEGASGWEGFVARYRDPWVLAGVAEVHPLVPDSHGRMDGDALGVIARSAGIFVGGGDTATYQRVFVASPAGDIIRDRFAAGTPYGGVSAGAMLAGDYAIVAGNAETDRGQTRRLLADPTTEHVELQLEEGLGLVRGLVVEAHFAEQGGFPRLAAALEHSESTIGLGLDEPAGAVIDGETMTVLGEGRAYLVTPSGPDAFRVEIRPPGNGFALSRSSER